MAVPALFELLFATIPTSGNLEALPKVQRRLYFRH